MQKMTSILRTQKIVKLSFKNNGRGQTHDKFGFEKTLLSEKHILSAQDQKRIYQNEMCTMKIAIFLRSPSRKINLKNDHHTKIHFLFENRHFR